MSFRGEGGVLLVDIGNSRIKWGLGKNARVDAGRPFASDATALTGEFDRFWGDLPAPSSVVACRVADAEIGQRLREWVERHWGLTIRFVQPESQAYGVVNGYDTPEKLGVDRWVALVAVRKFYPLPACVADCGTAITVDALDSEGRHLGGVIAPGLTLMRQSLIQRVPALSLAAGDYHGLLARNTAAAMLSGARQAGAGLIERTVRETGRLLGCDPHLVLSGGDAQTLAVELSVPYVLAPELVLQGLLIIAENTQ
jgi:type III pantothenate kinase